MTLTMTMTVPADYKTMAMMTETIELAAQSVQLILLIAA
jgi:hypothetical protein